MKEWTVCGTLIRLMRANCWRKDEMLMGMVMVMVMVMAMAMKRKKW
jgi:hypothetical protein